MAVRPLPQKTAPVTATNSNGRDFVFTQTTLDDIDNGQIYQRDRPRNCI